MRNRLDELQELYATVSELENRIRILLEEEMEPRYTEAEVVKSVEEYMEEERERRMNIIGRNGNDGLHYDEANYMYDKIDIQRPQQDNTYNPNMKFQYEVQKKEGACECKKDKL